MSAFLAACGWSSLQVRGAEQGMLWKLGWFPDFLHFLTPLCEQQRLLRCSSRSSLYKKQEANIFTARNWLFCRICCNFGEGWQGKLRITGDFRAHPTLGQIYKNLICSLSPRSSLTKWDQSLIFSCWMENPLDLKLKFYNNKIRAVAVPFSSLLPGVSGEKPFFLFSSSIWTTAWSSGISFCGITSHELLETPLRPQNLVVWEFSKLCGDPEKGTWNSTEHTEAVWCLSKIEAAPHTQADEFMLFSKMKPLRK